MPRLSHSLLLRAYKISPFLPLILRGTRTLDSAINEFRWLQEHVEESKPPSPQASRKRLLHLCKRRSRAEPLQYILGSQPFGPLDIICRPGVLIPRPETEAYTSHLAELLISGRLDEYLSIPAPETKQENFVTPRNQLSILDVCSGSGCISLLLHSLLSKSNNFPTLRTLGLDISPQAVALANENLARNIQNGHFPISKTKNEDDARQQDEELGNASISPSRLKRKKAREAKFSLFPRDKAIHFAKHDIFTSLPRSLGDFSIIISNPPYISTSSFARETTRSVRLYEPKLALVPDPESYSSSKKQSNRSTSSESANNIPNQSSAPGNPSSPKTRNPPVEIDPADIFYHRLLRLSTSRSAKILLMEVGDSSQAFRVLNLALSRPYIAKSNKFEIWRDFPGHSPQPGEDSVVDINGQMIPVKGAGNIRSVVLFRFPSASLKERRTMKRERNGNGGGRKK